MTATDQAFIRVFDGPGEPRPAAPHVSFATRGAHFSTAFAVVEMVEPTSAVLREEMETTDRFLPPVADVKSSSFSPHRRSAEASSPSLHEGESQNTYLPSAFRNLVGFADDVAEVPLPHAPPRHAAASMNESPAQRRPLPEFIDKPEPVAFRPALEVDAFRWPREVTQLLEQHRDALQPLAEAIAIARQRGEQIVVFHSTARGSGCTTMALATARLLAEENGSVVVVDADFTRPQLAAALGLAVKEGWETNLFTGAALAESVIRSLADRVSIVPLAAHLNEQQLSTVYFIDQVAAALRVLREHFDVVLVDGGCPADFAQFKLAPQSIFSASADGCVLVNAQDPGASNSVVQSSLSASLPIIGLIENFAGAGSG